jgi:hypothetical protein
MYPLMVLSHPDQFANVEPLLGVAVRVTLLSPRKLAEQMSCGKETTVPQSIPPYPVTIPLPLPEFSTVRVHIGCTPKATTFVLGPYSVLLSPTLTVTVYAPGVRGAVHETGSHPEVLDRVPPSVAQEQVKGSFSGSEATTVMVEVPPRGTCVELAVRLVIIGGLLPANVNIDSL